MRSRGKEIDCRTNYATMRHRGSSGDGATLTYEDYADSYRGSRRKFDQSSRCMTQDRRTHHKDTFEFDRNMESMHKFSKSSRDVYYNDKDNDDDNGYDNHTPPSHGPKSDHRRGTDYSCYEDYDDEETPPPPRSGIGGPNTKFNFDEQGFESDFNSPSSNGKALRFSNDFSEKESAANRPRSTQNLTSITGQDAVTTPTSASTTSQKLRFDDNITVSKFESPATGADDMFEDDDFSKAEFSFENEDQWMVQMPKKNLKSIRHAADNIKKSESVNIFAKKQDDPFEDDDFFKETTSTSPIAERNNNNSLTANGSESNNGSSTGVGQQQFKWEKNFAKFEDNI